MNDGDFPTNTDEDFKNIVEDGIVDTGPNTNDFDNVCRRKQGLYTVYVVLDHLRCVRSDRRHFSGGFTEFSQRFATHFGVPSMVFVLRTFSFVYYSLFWLDRCFNVVAMRSADERSRNPEVVS